jgi:PAS domain S-box-containing protein
MPRSDSAPLLPLPAPELADPWFAAALFDQTPDIVFFVKDRQARYLMVNETLAVRCGLRRKSEMLGRTAAEVFPPPLGDSYVEQDQAVLESGEPIRNRLELHMYPGGLSGRRGWCLTHKFPLFGTDGSIVALAGISKDLQRPDEAGEDYRQVARAVERLQTDYAEPLRIAQLARAADLSVDRFERQVRRIFQLTPRQLLTKARIDAASALLLDSRRSVADVAQACGYTDQSSFTRQFKATVGLTPSAYRESVQASPRYP